MRPTVSDLLRTRGAALIGREDELVRARAILGAEDGPVALHVHGPGGVGKTAYLREVERIARELDRPNRWVDVTDLAGPQDLLAVLGVEGTVDLGDALPPQTVVLVDHLEALGLAERWFWRELASALPADCTLAVASRRPSQHLEPRLAHLVELLPLRNLPTEAAVHLLQSHGIPESVEATAVADHAWTLVVGSDLQIAGVEGLAPRGHAVISALVSHVQKTAAHDPVVARAVIRVTSLLDPPESLMRPGMLLRVVTSWRRDHETADHSSTSPAVRA